MTPQVWIAIVIGLAATIEDLAHRQVSNWICGAALVAGIALHVVSEGWRGGLGAVLGSMTGFAVFLLFYLLGGMGGGDVKLMAGFGAILGVKRLLEAALWTAACGGIFAVLAIGFSALSGFIRVWMRRNRADEAAANVKGSERQRPVKSIPYAPAIAAGVWLSLVPKA